MLNAYFKTMLNTAYIVLQCMYVCMYLLLYITSILCYGRAVDGVSAKRSDTSVLSKALLM